MSLFHVGTAWVDLHLDMVRFDRELGQARGRLNALAGTLSGAGGAAGGGLLKSLGLAAGAYGIGTAVREMADMEKMVWRLKRVTADSFSEDQFKGFTDNLREMAATMSGPSIENIFGLATFGAKLGISGQELELFTRDLAAASVVLEDIPIEDAATDVARLSQLFHTGTQSTIRWIGALNEADIKSTAAARDILDIATRLGQAMSYYGASPQDTLALATTLKEIGVRNETSGTATSQVIGRMFASKSRRKFANMVGMEKNEFTKLLQTDLLGAIKLVETSLGRMGQVAATDFLYGLGLDGQRVRMVLLGLSEVTQRLGEVQKDVNKGWSDSHGILGAYAQQAGLTSSQWERLQNQAKLLVEQLGKLALPLVKGAMLALSDIISLTTENMKNSAPTIEFWGKVLESSAVRVAVLWRQVPLAMEWVRLEVRETGEQIAHIFRSTVDIVSTVMMNLGNFLADLFAQMGTAVASKFIKGFAGAITPQMLGVISAVMGPGIAMGIAAMANGPAANVVPNMGLLTNGVQPKVDALFRLPNRDPQQAAVEGRMAEAEDNVRNEHKNRERANQARGEAERAKMDADERRRASDMANFRAQDPNRRIGRAPSSNPMIRARDAMNAMMRRNRMAMNRRFQGKAANLGERARRHNLVNKAQAQAKARMDLIAALNKLTEKLDQAVAPGFGKNFLMGGIFQ